MERFALALVFALVLVACADGGEPSTAPSTAPSSATSSTAPAAPTTITATSSNAAGHQELAAARERWEAAAIGDHRLVVQDDCGECGPEFSAPSEVVVWDGEPYASGAALTVESVFARVERALANGEDVEATYDPDTGVPTEVWIDREARAYDGGVHLLIHDVAEGLPGDTASVDELRAARAIWDASHPEAYSFVVTFACDCPFEGRLFTRVERDQVVDSRVEQIDQSDIAAITMDQVFDDLYLMFSTAGGFDDGEIRVNGTAAYDSALGYPTWIGLDIEILERTEDTALLPDRLVYMISQFREEQPSGEGPTELDGAMERWARANLADYSYELTVHDIDTATIGDPFVVTVRQGVVATVLHEGVDIAPEGDFFTIDELFALISAAEAADGASEAAYDADLGFPWFVPISTFLDVGESTAWSIDNLTPLEADT
jgi:hypothetical protein